MQLMARNRKSVGACGEAAAAAYLEACGYRMVDVNVRPQGGLARGEIDLIAWHGEFLVFVEVKTRRTARGGQGTPAEAVNARKRRQLISLALAYLAKHDIDDVACRFDVVEVVESRAGSACFHILPDAFDASEGTD